MIPDARALQEITDTLVRAYVYMGCAVVGAVVCVLIALVIADCREK
jgi:hypothetical protein